MKNLLQEIKHNRIYSIVDNIINRCIMSGNEETTRYYSIKTHPIHGRDNDTLFYIRSHGHYVVKRDMFIKYGMSENITESQLAKYIYDKVIKPNKKE